MCSQRTRSADIGFDGSSDFSVPLAKDSKPLVLVPKRSVTIIVPVKWLLSSSWQQWRDLFEANDFITIAPGWPDDPDTVQEAHEDPSVFAHKMMQGVTDHYL